MAEAGRERQGQELSLLDLLARARVARAAPRSYRERAEAEGLRLLRLEVEDLFCYRRGEVDLGEGITVIAGPNGSGKSSLLEAIFFALYGSRACPAMGRSLGEILREGAKEGRVRLTFRCGGWEFTSEMGLKRQGERVQSERESCRLRREDGLEWVGVEEVSAQIQGLLHMDRDDFTNAVYVRQGEIDRLIRAGEEERRGMLDRLLRLERLDSYATRAKEGAARAVNRRLAGLEGELLGLRRELAALEAEDLPRVWAKLEGEIERKEKELAGLDGELARLERERAHLQERLRRLAVTEKELHELELELEGKRRRAKAQEGELDRLRLLLDGLTSQVREQRVKLEEEARLLAEQFRLLGINSSARLTVGKARSSSSGRWRMAGAGWNGSERSSNFAGKAWPGWRPSSATSRGRGRTSTLKPMSCGASWLPSRRARGRAGKSSSGSPAPSRRWRRPRLGLTPSRLRPSGLSERPNWRGFASERRACGPSWSRPGPVRRSWRGSGANGWP
jgi:chromosome segregation ATPase